MVKNIWLISDTHFGHANIIRHANRPFKNVDRMNDALLSNWNELIKPNDTVYHLGDVYFDTGYKHFHKCHGQKQLILGNHDNALDANLYNHVSKIHWWKRLINTVDGIEYKMLLTHAPLHESSLLDHAELTPDQKIELSIGNRRYKDLPHFMNIHGHIHNNKSPDGPYINISVEETNYKPIHIDELTTMVRLKLNTP